MGKQGRRIAERRIIFAVATFTILATVCTTTEQRAPIELRSTSRAIDMIAAIDESPTTVGLADSNLTRLNDEDLIDKQLDMMQSMGVQNVQVGISWKELQLSDGGAFLWPTNKIDYVINEAHRRGMGILAVLHETPIWARLDPENTPPLSGMPNPTKFGQFAGAVAEKYEGKISAIEIWNEPNGRPFLNPVDPIGYTAMLKAAYEEIKAHDDPDDPDDDITVVAGVLGTGKSLDDGALFLNPIDFLTSMYDDADAQGSFDALSFHPYHFDIPFSEGADTEYSPILQLRDLRALMQANGDGDLRVWATEYGVPTAPFDPTHPFDYNSPDKQAEFIEDFLNNWQKEEGTGPIFIYSTRDLETGAPGNEDNFGIFTTDWTAKPAVKVISDFINGLEPDNPILDLIRNIISGIVDITAAVIEGAVDLFVGVVDALVTATVWVVKTIAEVTVNVVQGIVELTSKVVHGIADAVVNTVTWVVDKVKSCLGIESSAPAQSRMGTAATVLTVDEPELAGADLQKSVEFAGPDGFEVQLVEDTLDQPELIRSEEVRSEVVEPEVTDTGLINVQVTGTEVTMTEVPQTEIIEPEAALPETEEPEVPETELIEKPTAPGDEVTEFDTEDVEDSQVPAVTPQTTTTTTTRTLNTVDKDPEPSPDGADQNVTGDNDGAPE